MCFEKGLCLDCAFFKKWIYDFGFDKMSVNRVDKLKFITLFYGYKKRSSKKQRKIPFFE